MCGRFVRRNKPADYAELFRVEAVPCQPSYNVAPTQPVAAVRVRDGQRECVLLRWGLIPYWAKDSKQFFINARGDTVLDKPAFRDSVNKRRCLIFADGYYEWKTEGKAKQPYFFHRRDDRPFAFAGLWDRWKGPDGPVESCTIVTTEANELSRPIHDRMPVILSLAGCDAWLDPEIEEVSVLHELLTPYPGDEMECYPVCSLVNSYKNDVPQCVERMA